MTVRAGHGSGAGRPHVEVLPVDELPAGVAAVARAPEAPGERTTAGTFAPGGSTAQAAGGRAKRGSSWLACRLGRELDLPETELTPYRRGAASFRRAQVAHLAATVGGGVCGPAPASLVATAAWQLAISRYIFDRAERVSQSELALASRLGNESRQNLLAAHELCAREAKGRAAQPGALSPGLAKFFGNDAGAGK
ncbi:MAG: hypothetical protein ABI548_16800 [Polyangiaceae bacterium]